MPSMIPPDKAASPRASHPRFNGQEASLSDRPGPTAVPEWQNPPGPRLGSTNFKLGESALLVRSLPSPCRARRSERPPGFSTSPTRQPDVPLETPLPSFDVGCGGPAHTAADPSPAPPSIFGDMRAHSMQATPRLAERDVGRRNPSPWEPCFKNHDEVIIWDDARSDGTPPASARLHAMPLGQVQAVSAGVSPQKLGRLDCREDAGKENLQCLSARQCMLECALERAAAAPTTQQTLDLLKDLDHRALPCEGIDEVPLCRMPAATTMSRGIEEAAALGAACPQSLETAEDPMVQPMPTSSQPSLLASCCGAVGPFSMPAEVRWDQPRHCERHISASGSLGASIPAGVVKKACPRRLPSHPWLCCGFTPIVT